MDVIRSAAAPPGSELSVDMVGARADWTGGRGWAVYCLTLVLGF
eukprot:CAMPEP_0116924620 /NCGR_PEP_ID=MMETSP0467-20121206/23625_1 /TAXON_ID=283647 /ORGANISM="Mesodinium pulex, Strain SPMC105" /LENGTH=43 /DNA_ID= /DNA_START= /DNA_END= /DNA_ORIENTATION=